MATKSTENGEPKAAPAKPEDTLTEKEKAKSSGPTSKPVEPEKATILDIDPSQPYPTGGAKGE